MAIVKVDLSVRNGNGIPRADLSEMWADVGKLKTAGEAVLVPATASRQSVSIGVAAIVRAFGMRLGTRKIGTEWYVVHL